MYSYIVTYILLINLNFTFKAYVKKAGGVIGC